MSNETPAICARIRFLSEEEGGRVTWPGDGVRSQLKIGDLSTSCLVNSTTGVTVFVPGIDYEVALHLLFWDNYGHLINYDCPVILLEGTQVVARGQYLGRPCTSHDS